MLLGIQETLAISIPSLLAILTLGSPPSFFMSLLALLSPFPGSRLVNIPHPYLLALRLSPFPSS
jgi:hypothetical protein